ncbi:low molecular weight protein-tyrosine-phosphatase [Arthrobacter sp. KK5.5]|uniref:low molecular weight protein-tyrosine-phosphatase n=1 Tax=Arthrobacter sp. KK5.5 TaxID=3373084 RepID=UPI003EE768D5
MYRITAVCTGNICRSPMAEFMIRQALEGAGVTDVQVDSSGISDWETGNPVDPRAGTVLASDGLDAAAHVARKFDRESFAATDLVLALDLDHFTELRRLAQSPADQAKIHMLRSFDPALSGVGPAEQGIYDPWFGDAADFEVCRDMIRAALPGLVEHVRKETAGARGA